MTWQKWANSRNSEKKIKIVVSFILRYVQLIACIFVLYFPVLYFLTYFKNEIPFFKITNVITSLGQTVKALNFYGYVVFNFFKVIRKALLRTLIKRARNKMFGLANIPHVFHFSINNLSF